MGIRLHGRDFTWADGPHSEKVVLINASAARVYWPGEDAVGKILMRDKEEDHVVGVVDDVHEESVEGGAGSQIYYPALQQRPDGLNWSCVPNCRPRRSPRASFTRCGN